MPYKFGAFSFTSYADKRKLIAEGFLADDEQNWKLTDAGQKVAREETVKPSRVAEFCRRHARSRSNKLLAEYYRRHPYYATRSEILDKLPLEPDTLACIAAAKAARKPAGLVTIGYEGLSLEGYLNALLRDGVTLLCDVRRNPLSRKYGFSKGTLIKACEGVGLRYEHLPELGIASDERRNLETRADYDALFARYKRHELPQQGAALAKIHRWIGQSERVALTCYEAQPSQCHRHCVAEALERLGSARLSAHHL